MKIINQSIDQGMLPSEPKEASVFPTLSKMTSYLKAGSHDTISCTQLFQIRLFVNYLFGCSVILQKNRMIQIVSCEPALRKIPVQSAFFTQFSKVFERFISNQLSSYFNDILSKYLNVYSSQHVLLRLIQEWKKALDENKVAGVILMDF